MWRVWKCLGLWALPRSSRTEGGRGADPSVAGVYRQRSWACSDSRGRRRCPHSSLMSTAIGSKAGREAAKKAKLLGLRGKVVALGQG